MKLFLKVLGVYFLLIITLCIGIVIWDLWDGKAGWTAIFGIGFIVLLVLLVGVVGFMVDRVFIRSSGKDGNVAVSYQFNSDKISLRSGEVSSTAEWSDLARIWIEQKLTILIFHEGNTTLIPTNQIPADTLRFLIKNAKEAGVIVVDSLKLA